MVRAEPAGPPHLKCLPLPFAGSETSGVSICWVLPTHSGIHSSIHSFILQTFN